jgi:hypothetical protein
MEIPEPIVAQVFSMDAWSEYGKRISDGTEVRVKSGYFLW